MPKRGENIHKRGDGRWEGRYKKGAKYASVYGKSYNEVKEKMRCCCVGNGNKSHSSRLIFKDLLLDWFNANKVKYKAATENKYEFLLNSHIIPDLGNLRVDALTETAINEYICGKLENGGLKNKDCLSSAYVKNIALIIGAAIDFSVQQGRCAPLKFKIFKPIPESKEILVLTVREQALLENYLHKNLDKTSLGILLSLYVGLRIGEVCALSWQDIDFKEQVIHIRYTVVRVKNKDSSLNSSKTRLELGTPKTRSSLRKIPLPNKLVDCLQKVRKASRSPYVISEKETFLSPRTYEYRFHTVLKNAGVADTNYHTLRHTFATRCIEAGADVKSLSEILGHSKASVTLNTYVHSSMELKRRQLEKL